MGLNTTQQNLPPLIRALCNPEVWPHYVDSVRVIETHVSWILLTGQYAYKIKQPLDLGFLDFSTLERRRAACQEELRLNRRHAPGIYLSVIAITGSQSRPVIATDLADGGPADGPILEYAVRMREFPQNQQLDRQLQSGDLQPGDMDTLAETIAEMYARAPVASPDDHWGTIEAIAKPALENFTELKPLVDDAADRNTLERIHEWTTTQLALLAPRMEQRRHDGFVRECHGDLHLSNLARFEGKIVAFDCIEFDPHLRWRDVMSEVGFMVMDLAVRQRVDMAWRFLNTYLRLTGDYSGAALLRFYLVYATMVRAKIAAIRAEQDTPGSAVYAEAARHYRMHLALADRAVRPRHPVVLLTKGTSGSGKTWLATRLSTVVPAISIRSDIERKRLHGLGALQRGDADIMAGIYSPEATRRTYQYLRDRARDVLVAKLDLIVDASFLQREYRSLFIELARDTGAALVILDCHANDQVLRERITKRASAGVDASEANEAVLAHQQSSAEPLTAAEQTLAIAIDTGQDVDPLRVAGDIWRKLGREILD